MQNTTYLRHSVFCLFQIPLIALISLQSAAAFSQVAEGSPTCDWSCCGRGQLGPWQVYETKNFRFLHIGQESSLPALAKLCEESRASTRWSWLGIESDEGWSPKCDVFLYASPQECAKVAGGDSETRGWSNLEIGRGKVWKRQLHLRSDQVALFEKVVPHELTHVVLADRFRTQQIPRWADEGIAILAEPAPRLRESQRILAEADRSGSVISMRELLSAKTYPTDRARADLFYAESASLVDYLVTTRSRNELIRLLEIAQQKGYESALRDVCGMDSTRSLEKQWKVWLASAGHAEPDTPLTATGLIPSGNNVAPTKQLFPGPMSRLLP